MKNLSLLISIFLLLIPIFARAEAVELSVGINVEICSSFNDCQTEELMSRQIVAIELEEIPGMEGTFTGSWSTVVKKSAFSFKGNISVTKSVYQEGMLDPVTYFITGWFKEGTVVHNTTQRLSDLGNIMDKSITGNSVWIEGVGYTPTLTVGKKISAE